MYCIKKPECAAGCAHLRVKGFTWPQIIAPQCEIKSGDVDRAVGFVQQVQPAVCDALSGRRGRRVETDRDAFHQMHSEQQRSHSAAQELWILTDQYHEVFFSVINNSKTKSRNLPIFTDSQCYRTLVIIQSPPAGATPAEPWAGTRTWEAHSATHAERTPREAARWWSGSTRRYNWGIPTSIKW